MSLRHNVSPFASSPSPSPTTTTTTSITTTLITTNEELAKNLNSSADKKQSFEALFIGNENSDLWYGIVQYLNGIDMINLTRSHPALLTFYLQHRLLLWKNLVRNEFGLTERLDPQAINLNFIPPVTTITPTPTTDTITPTTTSTTTTLELNSSSTPTTTILTEQEWIYWKCLYMKLYDFNKRHAWKTQSTYARSYILRDCFSLSPLINFNNIMSTQFLPKYAPIIELQLPDENSDHTSSSSSTSTSSTSSSNHHHHDTDHSNNNGSRNRSLSNSTRQKKVSTKLENLTSQERKMRSTLVNDHHYAIISTILSPVFHIVNLNTSKIERSFHGHRDVVNDIDAMCSDPFWIARNQGGGIGQGTMLHKTSSTSFNNRVLSASADSSIKIWNLMTGSCQATLKNGHQRGAYSVRGTLDQQMAISSGSDGSVCLWDCNQGVLLRCDKPHSNIAYSVRLDPHDASCAVSCGKDGFVKMYDLRNGANVVQQYHHVDHANLTTPVFCTDVCNKYVVSGTKSGYMYVWDMRYSRNCLQKVAHSESIRRIQLDEVKCVVARSDSLYIYEINHSYARGDDQTRFKVVRRVSKQSVPDINSFHAGTSVSFDTDLILCGDESGGVCVLSPNVKSLNW